VVHTALDSFGVKLISASAEKEGSFEPDFVGSDLMLFLPIRKKEKKGKMTHEYDLA
jgi:hypothetical protein